MPAWGGTAVQLSSGGGYRPIEAPGGKRVIYVSIDGTELRSVPSGGGSWTTVAAPVHPYPSGFAVTRDGVYYAAPPHSREERFVMFSSFETGRIRPVALARHPFGFGLSVSADGEHVLFDQEELVDSDLLVVKNFLSRR